VRCTCPLMTQSGHGDEGHYDGQELITDIAPPAVIGESYPKHGPLSRLSFGGSVKCRRKLGAV
jgi:hypothetical protein